MCALNHLTTIYLDEWPRLYRRALAAGSGVSIDPEIERGAAPHAPGATPPPRVARPGRAHAAGVGEPGRARADRRRPRLAPGMRPRGPRRCGSGVAAP